MTSVEKRRSGRKSGGHRKHSDGGYSDTSSGGSFLDENDREVSNLTDRAFRSLCIGDEAVYNDSDLCLSSPCTQRDRQMAFSHGGPDRDRGDREREELKRAAHENFSLRMQQYGQDWIHGGMYGTEINRDPQWEVYGERTQGRISATFQHSFVETSQQEKSLREEQLSFLSNGATELSSQQHRSRSRVSSLIRAFNSDGHRDVAGMDDKLREWNDETSWDKSALMSIQQELSEFSTSYQQNFHSGHFPSAGPFSSRDANFYSSEVAAVAHMSHNSASSFMRSSHSKHSMTAQVNCNSNFFIHSEFSPFKVWRDHNRFPFQQGEVSGFMHCSEFPKWYETPMYNELSMQDQLQGHYRGMRHPRNNMAPVIPQNHPRSTSTSTMLQKASAVEKRCESELAGHYPHRKRSQSLGANRLPSQRPSTASPTIEMSRRVRDTISSVKALQQKIKMMSEQNITSGVIENQQGIIYSHENMIPFGNNPVAVAPNVNTSTTPFNISQLLTPLVHSHQEAMTSDFQQYGVSPLPVEHAPVRAESRGATPDVRMSSYKSRATSLLFNLKDNRKRVKSTYSPPKFKSLETQNKQQFIQEPQETVIDMPDFPEPDVQFLQLEDSSRMNAAVNQYHNPGLPLTMQHSQPAAAHTGQYPEYNFSDYQTAQMQGQMVHHSGFTGFIPENYTSNQVANGQNLNEDLESFVPYKQGVIDNVGNFAGDVYRLKASYAETSRLNVDNNHSKDYLISKANMEQPFNETVGGVFTKMDRYEQFEDNTHDYNNVSSQDMWRQTNSQDTEKLSLKAATSPWKQEALMEKTRQGNLPSINDDLGKVELRDNLGIGPYSHKKADLVNTNISNQLPQYSFSNNAAENPAHYGQQQSFAFQDKNVHQKYSGHTEENEVRENYWTQNYNRYADQEYGSQYASYSTKEKPITMQETGQMKHTPNPKGHEMQSLQEAKPQFEQYTQKNSLSNPDNTSAPTMANQMKNRQFAEVKAEQVMSEHLKVQHAQAELATAQQWAQVEQPKADPAKLNLAEQTGSEKVKTEQAKSEVTTQKSVKQVKEEHIKEEIRKGEQTEMSREKQPEDQTKAGQTRVQKVTDEPRNITQEAGAKHMREEHGKQVKAEQAEAERLKEELIKTELANTEQASQERIKQGKTEPVTGKRLSADQVKQEKVSAECIKREQREAEPIGMIKISAEQAEAERRKEEQTKTEQINKKETKAEQVRTKENQLEKVKAEHIEVEKELIQAGQVNAEQPTTMVGTAKNAYPEERKAEQAKMERSKVEQAKAEVPKTENMQERSAKLTAKLTATQQVKSEPDRVEQVKSELAKAKAELAKIKEKMRGEQKEKVKNTVTLKEDDIAKNDVPLHVNISKNEDHKKHDQAAEMHQQEEASAVIQSSNQVYRGTDDYNRLREKYGFTQTVSSNKNKVSATGNVSLNDAKETQLLPVDIAETVNTDKSKDECSPANTGNKEEGGSFKSSEVAENQYVYSESSKEFKLSSGNNPPISLDKRANSESVADKVKDDSVEKLKKCDPLKDTDVSLQRDSDLAKPLPFERKHKSTEHNTGPSKDLHFTPPRALSHKERAQTKQEILTSKIKAHAEKEISAIKEGFAIRDGFSSKNSTKQLGGIQGGNIRQRPPSQEGPKKHESTSNITPKHQTEPLGGQMEPVKSASPPSSNTIPVTSATATTQLADHSQKQETRNPLKSNSDVPEPLRKTNQTGSYNMRTTEDLAQNQKHETYTGIKSPMQNKDQTPKIDLGKQQANHGEISGKQKEELKDNPAINTDNVNKKIDASSQAASSKSVMTERAESKEAAQEDSEPSISLVVGQNTGTVVDDSLQIMGIMVTVRERKPSVSIDEGNNTTKTQTERQCNISELDKCPLNSGLEASEKILSSKEASVAKAKDIQEKEDQTKVGVNSLPETVQANLSLETRKNNTTENVTQKRTNLQQETSSINAKPQRETQPEPLAEKGVPFTVTVPAKNKALPETQPHLHKQDTIASKTKDQADKTPKEKSDKGTDEVKTNTRDNNPQKIQTSENYTAKMVNTGISKHETEPLIKHGIHSSMKEDMTSARNQSKSSSIDGKSAKLPEEKRHDSAPPKTSNKVSPTSDLTENENRRQYNEPHIEESNQEDDNVHIDCIAIRVVPAVTKKDSVTMVGKHHIPTFPSDAGLDNEHKQVASSSCDQKANPLNFQNQTKDLSPASSEITMKDSLEDRITVQDVLSSVRKLSDSLKISHKQNSTNTTSGTTQAVNEKPEKLEKFVDETNIQPMEGDYFQVQGVSNNEPHNNRATVGDASKGGELSALQQNKTVVSNESHKEGKTEAFVFNVDPDKRKAFESSSVSIQEESVKKKKWEREDKLASKQPDGSMERWSNNAKTEAVQANLVRKHHTENQSSLSAMERQSSRNSHATKENTLKENPDVKPKPKERSSTIPEISALADYARLKVIVSEDTEVNRDQEFPPNKKEGFFPLIQSRHSRRPVFTADPQDLSVKKKSLPSKTETSAKVNKEPKALVYPITEKEHQRTGMFKLGDKERHEKMLLDAKVNEGAAKDAHHKEKIKSPAAQTEHMAGPGTQRACQDQSVHQPNNSLLQATTSAVNRPRDTAEGLTYLDKNSLPHENMTPLSKDKRNEQQDKDTGATTEDWRADKLKNERPGAQHEETKAKPQGRLKQVEEERASRSKEERTEDDARIKHMIEKSRASLAEEERRAIQREEERRARDREAIAIKIKEKREKQREAERRAEEEAKAKKKEEEKAAQKEEEIRAKQRETEERKAKLKEEEKERNREAEERRRVKKQEEERAAQEEQRKKAAEKEQQMRAAQEEHQRKAAQEEQQRRAAQEEQQRRVQEEQKRRAAQEEQQKRVQEEQKRRAAQEEQQRRAAQEEQQRRAVQEEQQRRAALEEQQRRAAQEEQQRRAAQEEQQRRAVQEEQQRRAALEEQQRRAAQEEQQRRAAQEEQQRRAQEEQKRRAALEEQQKRTALEEQHRRAAHEEQQRKAAQEEQQKRVAQEEQQKRAQEEQKRRAALEEQQRRAAQEEQQRKIQEEQKRRAAQEEQKRRAEEEEKQMRAAQEEHQRRVQEEQKRRAAQEEQKRRAAQEEQQRQASLDEEQKQVKQTDEKIRKEEKTTYISEAERLKHIQAQKKAEQQIDEQRREQQKKEEWMKTQREEKEKEAVEKVLKQREKTQVKEERVRLLEKSQAPPKEKGAEPDEMLSQTEDQIQAKKREQEEMLANQREKVRVAQIEKQDRAPQVDTLQYYAITSTESERTSRERQILSPLPPQQRNNPSGLESTDDSHTRPYRPHAPASPAPSLPRSNTSSPAFGVKPSMFRIKDNTIRGSSLTKSVKPRFHKNYGEDFWMGSPVGSERGEEEQEVMRRNAGTPVHPDPGFNRLAAINESSTFQSASSPLDYSAYIPHHRPFSRRSIATDEDDSRSVISNMSEDVESYATGATDLADIRGLYDSERPESACSFSSDVSRSMGKPPAVPPKSEKALRRAKRLTSRRINKELSKAPADNPAEVEKEVSSIPSSSSFEVRSSNRHAVASPHFSAPVSLAHAPALGSSLPSSHAEHQSSHRSFHTSPHATGPVSLPVSSPHATAAVSLPTVSPHAAVPASQPVAPKTVAHVPSSPTLHHANHPAPVTQYQVESGYPQSYPLTQRKVLQDLGSGQYFVVDVPVPVKTKTFFDPETGKYVQLNVRESGQSISQPQPQQSCSQPQLQPQMQIKPQQQPLPQTSPASKQFGFYQGYQGYPQGYQPTAVNSVHSHRSSAPVALHQEQQPVRESHSYGYPAPETGQNSEGHRYSPEKTPYMDTVNDKDKTYNRVYNTHGSYESFPECDTNSQLAGSSICENDNSAPSQYQPDIITMGELEDFMEVSDW